MVEFNVRTFLLLCCFTFVFCNGIVQLFENHFVTVFILCLFCTINIQERKRLNPFNQVSHPWFLCMTQTRILISIDICFCFICVQMVWGSCSFCWYWRKCWPSLFSFYNHHILWNHMTISDATFWSYLLVVSVQNYIMVAALLQRCSSFMKYFAWNINGLCKYNDLFKI